MDLKPVRVRFAPSPTGSMHLGSARTALYDFLIARRTGGQFILRIEDTDQKRFVPGAEEELINGMHWLGIEWDEGPDVGGPYGPYRQSERREIYHEHAWKLVNTSKAYPCFCTPDRLEKVRQEQQKRKEPPRYDGHCRTLDPVQAAERISTGERYVIRFMTPQEGTTTVHDLLRGDITVENRNIDDYILLKSDGLPTYHLAAMVDDHLMNITHVIRGSEWLGTFPLHALILRAFGWEEPKWIHLSVFLKPSGKGKMSKRDTAQALNSGYSIYVKDLKELGYIPEGVLNWIVLMGWGVAEGDVLTIDEMIELFDVKHLNPSPAAINFSKLDHFNGTHIRRLTNEDLSERIKPFFVKAGYKVNESRLQQITPLIRERIVTLDEAVDLAGFLFEKDVQPDPLDLVAKGLSPAQAAEAARRSYEVLSTLDNIETSTAEPLLRELVDRLGLSAGQVFGILRVAVTGRKVSPPLFETMEIIGKEEVLRRINNAVSTLDHLAAEK